MSKQYVYTRDELAAKVGISVPRVAQLVREYDIRQVAGRRPEYEGMGYPESAIEMLKARNTKKGQPAHADVNISRLYKTLKQLFPLNKRFAIDEMATAALQDQKDKKGAVAWLAENPVNYDRQLHAALMHAARDVALTTLPAYYSVGPDKVQEQSLGRNDSLLVLECAKQALTESRK